MRTIVLAAAICSLAGAAHARSDAPLPWSGVWQGTVGGAQVRACFGMAGDPDQGAYYYLRHLQLIGLEPADRKGTGKTGETWTERDPGAKSKDAPRWLLSAEPGGTLSGSWSRSGSTLPVRLTRVSLKAEEAETPCGGMTFQLPRIVQPTVVRTPAMLDGIRYIKLIAKVGDHFGADIETFELPSALSGAARINAELAKTLPRLGGREPPGYLDCAMNSAGSFGETGEIQDRVEPDMITRRWLVTHETETGFCGGAHPYAGETLRVWSLTSGEKIDPWSWFTADAVQRPAREPGDLITIGPKLRAMLAARWSRKDEDCSGVPEDQNDWDVHPTREGMAFWPQLPHVVFACSEDVVIPYRELAPFLNPKGRAAVDSIVQDLRGLPLRPKAKS